MAQKVGAAFIHLIVGSKQAHIDSLNAYISAKVFFSTNPDVTPSADSPVVSNDSQNTFLMNESLHNDSPFAVICVDTQAAGDSPLSSTNTNLTAPTIIRTQNDLEKFDCANATFPSESKISENPNVRTESTDTTNHCDSTSSELHPHVSTSLPAIENASTILETLLVSAESTKDDSIGSELNAHVSTSLLATENLPIELSSLCDENQNLKLTVEYVETKMQPKHMIGTTEPHQIPSRA